MEKRKRGKVEKMIRGIFFNSFKSCKSCKYFKSCKSFKTSTTCKTCKICITCKIGKTYKICKTCKIGKTCKILKLVKPKLFNSLSAADAKAALCSNFGSRLSHDVNSHSINLIVGLLVYYTEATLRCYLHL